MDSDKEVISGIYLMNLMMSRVTERCSGSCREKRGRATADKNYFTTSTAPLFFDDRRVKKLGVSITDAFPPRAGENT